MVWHPSEHTPGLASERNIGQSAEIPSSAQRRDP
jgi:hypothetical protein